jgi:hypothetical protein
LGIYALDGDRFKWCANEPGKDERPQEFQTAEKSRYLFIVFQRAKK